MTQDEIAESIVHVLTIYPKLSNSMLQIGLGTHVKPKDWRPVLNDLIEEGRVCVSTEMHQTTKGRTHTYTSISLVG